MQMNNVRLFNTCLYMNNESRTVKATEAKYLTLQFQNEKSLHLTRITAKGQC